MAKMFEDALRSLSILEEDSPRYVTRSVLESIVVPSKKGKARRDAQGSKDDASDEDWLEITINPIKTNVS